MKANLNNLISVWSQQSFQEAIVFCKKAISVILSKFVLSGCHKSVQNFEAKDTEHLWAQNTQTSLGIYKNRQMVRGIRNAGKVHSKPYNIFPICI